MASTFASEHLAKALSCRAARYGDCAFCKNCDIPELNGVKLCSMSDTALMEMAAKRIRAASKAQNKIVKTMKKTLGDVDVARCVICEYGAQCQRESQGDANDNLRFWRCVDGSEFKLEEG